MKISQLKRNDVAGAVAYYKKRKASGKWDPSLMTMLFRLQDDPTELSKQIDNLSKRKST